jgi:hypothetical protein
MNTRILAVVLGWTLAAGATAHAQTPGSYPNVDRPMALSGGDTIQLLNRILVDRAPGQRGARIDIQYATRIPASDVTARAEQADRLAQIIGPEASKIGARRFTISICDTRACAETREQPKAWYIYERGVGGIWQRSRGS